MVTPRQIRVLVIDDTIKDEDRRDLVIDDWLKLQRYWLSAGDRHTTPDIILCDVNFKDDDVSPLTLHCRAKPTGFLYAIPFLAVARATGCLTVVEFHSGTIQNFSADSSDPDVSYPMRLLAAELIGVVHALMASAGSKCIK